MAKWRDERRSDQMTGQLHIPAIRAQGLEKSFKVPDDYFVVRPRTYGNFLACRGFRDEHGDPHPAVEVIKAKTRINPLAQVDDPPPMRFVNVSAEPMCAVPPANPRFWHLLDEVVQSEPPESAEPLTLGMFASFGIQQGQAVRPRRPDARDPGRGRRGWRCDRTRADLPAPPA